MALDRLRTPLFVVALFLWLLAVCVEMGAQEFLGSVAAAGSEAQDEINRQVDQQDLSATEKVKMRAKIANMQRNADPPGLAIRYLALLDGLVLLTVVMMGLSLIVSKGLVARVQGVITLIVSLLVLLGSIALLILAFVLLMLMVSLLLATPFGTLAYLALYGFFNRGGASVALSIIMVLKVAFVICLVLAHQRFLLMKGLMLILLTSLLANVIVSFLHGFVPIILVSITDAIAAIVLAILALIWALFMLIGSISGTFKAIA